MPHEYIRHCRECGEDYDTIEPMHAPAELRCPYCGGVARRRPLLIRVNWGGLKPSQGRISDGMQQLINDAPRRREEEANGI